jgi:hypothetical protein
MLRAQALALQAGGAAPCVRVHKYDEFLQVILDAQLSLEAMSYLVRANDALFPPRGGDLIASLGIAEPSFPGHRVRRFPAHGRRRRDSGRAGEVAGPGRLHRPVREIRRLPGAFRAPHPAFAGRGCCAWSRTRFVAPPADARRSISRRSKRRPLPSGCAAADRPRPRRPHRRRVAAARRRRTIAPPRSPSTGATPSVASRRRPTTVRPLPRARQRTGLPPVRPTNSAPSSKASSTTRCSPCGG